MQLCDHEQQLTGQTILGCESVHQLQGCGTSTAAESNASCIGDDEDVLECEESFLESFGYAVLTGPSGRGGLELASTRSIDVVMEKMSLAGPA